MAQHALDGVGLAYPRVIGLPLLYAAGVEASERANLPRWNGQPGHYEIWFFVIFHPTERQAWWLRFTTFSPRQGGSNLAIVWAAAFGGARPVVARTVAHADDSYRAAVDRFDVEIGSSRLWHGGARGESHGLAWDLSFAPAPAPHESEPLLLRSLPLPVHVAHVHQRVQFRGSVTVDGSIVALDGAPGVQKHIWGHRRVESLAWLYCPDFEGEPAAMLEATSVALRAGRPPQLTFFSTAQGGAPHRRGGLWSAVRSRVVKTGPYELTFFGRDIEARAWAEPETLVGYTYRDPAGWDVYVAQSDVASCDARIDGRRLRNRGRAALEFHGLEPLPSIEYLPWQSV